MSAPLICVIEDEEVIAASVAARLRAEGFAVGREIRARSAVPIIMVTGKGDTIDRVVGLELGADDYITKPFSPRQLVARVKAVLRRAQDFAAAPDAGSEELRARDLTLDLRTRTLRRDGQEVRMTPLEYKILHYLMVNRGRVLTNSAIVEHVWGFSGAGNEDLVKVHVHRLRHKLERDPQNPEYLKTVPGVGCGSRRAVTARMRSCSR